MKKSLVLALVSLVLGLLTLLLRNWKRSVPDSQKQKARVKSL